MASRSWVFFSKTRRSASPIRDRDRKRADDNNSGRETEAASVIFRQRGVTTCWLSQRCLFDLRLATRWQTSPRAGRSECRPRCAAHVVVRRLGGAARVRGPQVPKRGLGVLPVGSSCTRDTRDRLHLLRRHQVLTPWAQSRSVRTLLQVISAGGRVRELVPNGDDRK
jgi:hypothetical protein